MKYHMERMTTNLVESRKIISSGGEFLESSLNEILLANEFFSLSPLLF